MALTYETDQEVTLTEIVRGLLRWLRKHMQYLLAGMLVGGIFGYVYFQLTPKQYSGTFIAYGSNFEDVRLREIILDLTALKYSNDNAELARRLQLPDTVISQIREFGTIIHNQLEADIPAFMARDVKTRFLGITITVLKPELLPRIQEALINYIDRQPEVMMRMEARRENAISNIKAIENEIAFLNQFKTERSQYQNGSKAIVFADPAAISVQMVDLAGRIAERQSELRMLAHELMVVKSVSVVHKHIGPGKYRATAFWAFMGLLSVLGFYLLRGAWKWSK